MRVKHCNNFLGVIVIVKSIFTQNTIFTSEFYYLLVVEKRSLMLVYMSEIFFSAHVFGFAGLHLAAEFGKLFKIRQRLENLKKLSKRFVQLLLEAACKN